MLCVGQPYVLWSFLLMPCVFPVLTLLLRPRSAFMVYNSKDGDGPMRLTHLVGCFLSRGIMVHFLSRGGRRPREIAWHRPGRGPEPAAGATGDAGRSFIPEVSGGGAAVAALLGGAYLALAATGPSPTPASWPGWLPPRARWAAAAWQRPSPRRRWRCSMLGAAWFSSGSKITGARPPGARR